MSYFIFSHHLQSRSHADVLSSPLEIRFSVLAVCGPIGHDQVNSLWVAFVRHAASYGASSHYGTKRQILAFFGHSKLSLPLGEVWVKAHRLDPTWIREKLNFKARLHIHLEECFFFSSSVQPKSRIAKRREIISTWQDDFVTFYSGIKATFSHFRSLYNHSTSLGLSVSNLQLAKETEFIAIKMLKGIICQSPSTKIIFSWSFQEMTVVLLNHSGALSSCLQE